MGGGQCPPYLTLNIIKFKKQGFHHRGAEHIEKSFLLLAAPQALLTK